MLALLDDGGMLDMTVGLLAALGALEQGTTEILNYSLISDLLALGTDMQTAVLGAFGLAGALMLTAVITQEVL